MKPVRTLRALALALAVVVGASSSLGGKRKPRKLVWHTDEAKAFALATKLDTPVLLFFRADWAADSVTLERQDLVDPALGELLARFALVRHDLTHGDAAARPWGVSAVPGLLVVGHDRRVRIPVDLDDTVGKPAELAVRLRAALATHAVEHGARDRLAALLQSEAVKAGRKVDTDALAGPLGTRVLRALIPGAYPGTGVRSLLVHAGKLYGRYGDADLAQLARDRGWFAAGKAPGAADLARLFNFANYNGMLSLDGEPRLTVSDGQLTLELVRVEFPSQARSRMQVVLPAAGPVREIPMPL